MPRIVTLLSLALLSLFASTRVAHAQTWNDNGTGLAIGGYDVVAYFTDHHAVLGTSEHVAVHGGATFRFASEAHRAAFVAQPARYLPAYGGYCAYAAADGRVVRVDPQAFSIEGGRLYLNYSLEIRTRWLADRARYIRQANERWPSIAPH